jgi:hypothetical protein
MLGITSSAGLLGRGMFRILGIVLGVILLASALPKIFHPYHFLGNVYEYELVGPRLGTAVAIVLPWLELILGVCLVGGICLGGALLTASGLMAVFMFAQASAIHRRLAISCGCFGAGEAVGYGSMIRTALLLLTAVMAYVCFMVFWPRAKQSTGWVPTPAAD